MAKAAVRSKAMVLLFLSYFLMYFPLFVGVLCLSLFCYALLCVHFSIDIILEGKRERERAGFFSIIVLQMYCYYKCSVALPHSVVGWSAVCDCGIPDHTHLLFPMKFQYPFLQISKGGRSSKAYVIFLVVRVYTL